jgi:hypothetical protein
MQQPLKERGLHGVAHDSVYRHNHSGETYWPDFALPVYYPWDYILSHPANIDDLKRRSLDCIRGIREEIPKPVTITLPYRVERRGDRLLSVVFKH